MPLIHRLPSGPLDIIGDIHGEYEALCQLLAHLGYDEEGKHPERRTLVFVGDYCDRGPDSPAVLALVARLVRAGRACGVLGNHEMNLLREDPKDGAGWFFEERATRDNAKYAPYARPQGRERDEIVRFLSGLPLVLEREDVRVVHAAWINDCVSALRAQPSLDLLAHYRYWDDQVQAHADSLREAIEHERTAWPHGLEDPECRPPFLAAHAEHDLTIQMGNPLRVLTSGVEQRGATPFYASGKWRFVERGVWWDSYEDAVPVVVGHYWRRHGTEKIAPGKHEAQMFAQLPAERWHGKRGNVMCIDYSVGARWHARKTDAPLTRDYKLAALRWPERVLQFDDGLSLETTGFGQPPGI